MGRCHPAQPLLGPPVHTHTASRQTPARFLAAMAWSRQNKAAIKTRQEVMTASESHVHLVSDRGKAIWITHWLQTARKTMSCPQRGLRPDKEGFCLQRSLLERHTKVSISSGRCFCLDSKHVIQKVTLGKKGEMGLKSVVSEVSPIFSSANRPSVLKGGMESWFPMKEFTLKRKKPRQLSSHRNQGNAVNGQVQAGSDGMGGRCNQGPSSLEAL